MSRDRSTGGRDERNRGSANASSAAQGKGPPQQLSFSSVLSHSNPAQYVAGPNSTSSNAPLLVPANSVQLRPQQPGKPAASSGSVANSGHSISPRSRSAAMPAANNSAQSNRYAMYPSSGTQQQANAASNGPPQHGQITILRNPNPSASPPAAALNTSTSASATKPTAQIGPASAKTILPRPTNGPQPTGSSNVSGSSVPSSAAAKPNAVPIQPTGGPRPPSSRATGSKATEPANSKKSPVYPAVIVSQPIAIPTHGPAHPVSKSTDAFSASPSQGTPSETAALLNGSITTLAVPRGKQSTRWAGDELDDWEQYSASPPKHSAIPPVATAPQRSTGGAPAASTQSAAPSPGIGDDDSNADINNLVNNLVDSNQLDVASPLSYPSGASGARVQGGSSVHHSRSKSNLSQVTAGSPPFPARSPPDSVSNFAAFDVPAGQDSTQSTFSAFQSRNNPLSLLTPSAPSSSPAHPRGGFVQPLSFSHSLGSAINGRPSEGLMVPPRPYGQYQNESSTPQTPVTMTDSPMVTSHVSSLRSPSPYSPLSPGVHAGGLHQPSLSISSLSTVSRSALDSSHDALPPVTDTLGDNLRRGGSLGSQSGFAGWLDGVGSGGDAVASSADQQAAPSAAQQPSSLSISQFKLLYDPPVGGCELRPYVLMRAPGGKTFALPQGPTQYNAHHAPSSDYARFRWLVGQKRTCNARDCPNAGALQCLTCVKLAVPKLELSFFCSGECMQAAWKEHCELCHQGQNAPPTAWHYDDFNYNHLPRSFTDTTDMPFNSTTMQSLMNDVVGKMPIAASNEPSAVSSKFPFAAPNTWTEVSQERWFTPSHDDVGRAIHVEVAPIIGTDANGAPVLGKPEIIETGSVVPQPPPPPPRSLLYPPEVPHNVSGQGFTVMCYNVLAEIYATGQLYPYCPVWALQWNYRKHVLLRDIVSHDCDVVCLQEVQADHYEQFFHPELAKHGYEGVYKRKTREAVGDNLDAIDGCAIFYRRDRFIVLQRYDVDFNKEAMRCFPNNKKALRRLLRGNVALVLVLEELVSARGPHRRKRRLCVTNTHIYWDPEYDDVKLWQTWILCQELEKLVVRNNLPLLICGDFNSVIKSAVYELLGSNHVSLDNPALKNDPTQLLPAPHMLTHRLPLLSAYDQIGEPKYTNYTGHFVGVLDYMFFSKTNLAVTAVLDVDEEEHLRRHVALPSPQYSSDHVALVAHFDWLEDGMS